LFGNLALNKVLSANFILINSCIHTEWVCIWDKSSCIHLLGDAVDKALMDWRMHGCWLQTAKAQGAVSYPSILSLHPCLDTRAHEMLSHFRVGSMGIYCGPRNHRSVASDQLHRTSSYVLMSICGTSHGNCAMLFWWTTNQPSQTSPCHSQMVWLWKEIFH
jgi:hypothetical protein